MRSLCALALVSALLAMPAAAQTKHGMVLTWNASPTAGVDHYGIYRGTAPGGPYTLMGKVLAPKLSFVNGSNPDGSPLPEGQLFCYVIVAFLGAQFSKNSNETCATVPTAPNPAVNLAISSQN